MFLHKKHNFTTNDSEWSFEEHLDSLVDFAQSNYHLKGTFCCVLEMCDDNNNDFNKPQEFQQNALDYFIANQELVLSNVAVAIINQVYHENVSNEILSVADALSFVKQKVSFESFNILGTQKDNYSYSVIVFGYEDEHDLGVITYKDRVIAIRDADTALFDWDDKILQDKLTQEEWKKHLEEENKRVVQNVANIQLPLDPINAKQSRKWWEFWK